MNLKIKYFGIIAEITGKMEENLVSEIGDTEEITQLLALKYPAMENLEYKIAVDQEIILSKQNLTEKSVIALLPPFSGG